MMKYNFLIGNDRITIEAYPKFEFVDGKIKYSIYVDRQNSESVIIDEPAGEIIDSYIENFVKRLEKNMVNYYVENLEDYPLADELVEATEALLQKKGVILTNDDTDSYQLDKRISVYGEDFRFLRDAIQDILNKRVL